MDDHTAEKGLGRLWPFGRKPRHRHDYQRVGYGGAGWSLFRCACGAQEIDA